MSAGCSGGRCEVQTVADGQEALEAIRANRPDLILTDVMMPNLDGFGLLRAIRSDAELRDIPVIMLSARAGEESRVEGLDAGADDYLVKPFSARELIARVSSLLELTRVRQEALVALRDSERRTRALFQQAPGFICVLNGPEPCVRVRERFLLASGWKPRLLLARLSAKLFRKPKVRDISNCWTNAIGLASHSADLKLLSSCGARLAVLWKRG